MNDYEYILSMQHITKIYGNGFMANNDITFEVKEGEIHGLVGENGAGKSTLMKVLFGQENPETGSIFVRGEEVKITSPLKALDLGIGMVHQHFMLVPSMTVTENMVLGSEPKKGPILMDREKAGQMTREISEKYNLPINPNATIKDLSVGFKQRVEILKILLRGAEILLLDEPTAVLTPQETKELFVQLKSLRDQGFTIIFISHKLNEIKEICDRITVLRNGKVVGTKSIEEVSETDISRMMVGRDVMLEIDRPEHKAGKVMLAAKGIGYTDKFGKKALYDVSFTVREGEIVGVAGVEGNGQTELAQICTRLVDQDEGTVTIKGKDISKLSIKEVKDENVGFISEDRIKYDLVRNATIEENMISNRFDKKEYHNVLGTIYSKKVGEEVNKLIEDYNVYCDSKDSEIATLSGGNMQKVITARECSVNPDLLIVSQPTRGIDVGATEFIRRRLVEMRTEGCGILMFSSDLSEILECSDRILVFYNGRIVAHLVNGSDVDDKLLGEYMLGIRKQSEEELGGASIE